MFEGIKWGVSFNPSWDRTGMPEDGFDRRDAALEDFFNAIDNDVDYVALYHYNTNSLAYGGGYWERRKVYRKGMPKPKRPKDPSICTIPDGTKIINNIKTKTKIVELYIPASVEEIADGVFYNARSLKKVVFADNSNLKKIGNQTFENCTNLTSINLPSSLKKIGEDAFYGCESLKSINLPENISYIGEKAFADSGIESINLPKNLIEIDSTVFCRTKLKNIIIPNNVKNIKRRAFMESALESITIPSSVEYIGSQAFAYCKNLKTVNILGNTTKMSTTAFHLSPASIIYNGSKQNLKNSFIDADNYDDFEYFPKNIVYKTESAQNLESILAESFEKTIKNLQKEGLFENVKSFDLDFTGKGINIKLNEDTYKWGANFDHNIDDDRDDNKDNPDYIAKPDKLFKSEEAAIRACEKYYDANPRSYSEVLRYYEDEGWQVTEEYDGWYD